MLNCESETPFPGSSAILCCALSFRKTLQIDGPYDDAFYQKLLDLSTEDDGTVAFALTKVGRTFRKHLVLCRLLTLTWGFPKTRRFS